MAAVALMVMNMIGGGVGAATQHNRLGQSEDTLLGLAQPQGQNFQSPFGSFFQQGGQGGFQLDPGQQQFLNQMVGGSQNQLGGGLFNDPNFQQAFGSNNIGGAFGGAQGGLQNLFQGPGGLEGLGQSLFSQGQGLFDQAGDVSGLISQNLDSQRALAAPFEQRQRIAGQESIFGRTGGATSGGRQEFADILNSQNTADVQRVLGAQQFGQNQQQQLFGQGNALMNLGQGIQGQQFGQALGTQQQNISQGQQRLGNSLDLFGLGQDTFSQNFGQGLQGFGQNTQMMNQIMSMLFQGQNADANLVGAQSGFADPLAQIGITDANNMGSFFGNMFSDERLKEDVKKIGTIGDIGWYEWQWNDIAEKMGISGQPNYGVLAQEASKRYPDAVHMTATGYLQVNYRKLMRAL